MSVSMDILERVVGERVKGWRSVHSCGDETRLGVESVEVVLPVMKL